MARETELKQQRADLEKTIAALAPLNDLLQQKLQVASTLYDKVPPLVVDDPGKHGVDVATERNRMPRQGPRRVHRRLRERRGGGPCTGIDMAALADTPVVAVVDGVLRHDVGGAGGNGVSSPGSTASRTTTRTSRTTPALTEASWRRATS